jgi:hypothetical protein
MFADNGEKRKPPPPACDHPGVRRRRLASVLAMLVLAPAAAMLSGCAGDGRDTSSAERSEQPPEGEPDGAGGAPPAPDPDSEAFEDADPGDVEVIRGWVDALREGDVEAAAGYFAIPSIAQNGPTALRITGPRGAEAFNRSLPCGAVLIAAESSGQFTTATFELTERPGGNCGSGVGEEAATAFVIEDGRIAEWRRVPAGEPPPTGEIV